jgi:general secretion pathway protein L
MNTMALRQWQSIRNSQAWKGTADFLTWWKSELLAGLPPKWRDLVDYRPECLMVRQSRGEILMWRNHNGHDELGRFHVSDDLDTARQSVLGALGQLEEEQPPTTFLIDHDQVLCKTITVPAAAEDNLRQVLAFEMDRHTPFKSDQLYFDCFVSSHNHQNRTIKVELVVVRRESLDQALDMIVERGLSLDSVDVCREADDGVLTIMGVNLLPLERRARRSRRQLKLNLLLAGMFAVLMYLVMWQSLLARDQAIESLRGRVNQATRVASEVKELRDRLVEAREAARFLSEKKASLPVMVDLLDRLTRVLPDDTWLQRLQVNDGTIVLTGQSPEAAALIGLLEGEDCLEAPAFKGAVTPDPNSGKERFTIEAQLVLDKECGDGATAS